MTKPQEVEAEFLKKFIKLIGASNEELLCPNAVVIKKDPCLTRKQQLKLIKGINREEIDAAINDMPKDKSPGIDGYSIEFFTTH